MGKSSKNFNGKIHRFVYLIYLIDVLPPECESSRIVINHPRRILMPLSFNISTKLKQNINPFGVVVIVNVVALSSSTSSFRNSKNFKHIKSCNKRYWLSMVGRRHERGVGMGTRGGWGCQYNRNISMSKKPPPNRTATRRTIQNIE